jgi:biopolymer transport protein ExbD
MLDLFGSPRSKHKDLPDLNVVPILDMLISVVFFLLLTTTFLQFTKQSVPPSSISKITDPVAPPPVSPKIIGVMKNGDLRMLLTWTGEHPGHAEKTVTVEPNKGDETQNAVVHAITDLITDFNTKYPKEKTIQIGLGEDVPYQHLVSIMDGSKEKLPDMVLFSYLEATARAKKTE